MTKSNKTAIITGAAQGIGEATALRLADDGVGRLLLIDRQAEKLESVARTIRAAGADAECLAIDLTDIDTLQSELGKRLSDLEQVNILVNAAGSTARGGLADTSTQTFDHIMALNVRAPFFVMQMVTPLMPAGSVVVNICSMLAYGGPPFLLAYSASKAALVALTKGAANSVKWNGVRIFGINLGWTWTPGEQQVQTKVHGLAEDWREDIGAKQPFGRLLMPDDPAAVVSFLASPDAAMMTGAIIDLDQHVAGTVDDNPGNQ